MVKKYSKLVLVSLICLSIMCSYSLVSAKEVESYYTNDNGVSLSKEEYDFLTKMYWDGYQKIMTKDEYKKFHDNDIIHGEYNEKTLVVNEEPITRGTFHSTGAKSIKIATACQSNCLVSVVATWLGNPTIRSYDVMGAYLDGVSLQSTPVTRVSSSDSVSYTGTLRTFNNGFGVSFKLPSGSGIIINQDFYASKGGNIYASYQHAMSNTTSAVSQDYTLSRTGYGKVFNFGSSAKNVYDAMNGVDISV